MNTRKHAMPSHIKVGTTVLVKGSTLEEYVIERIVAAAVAGGTRYTIEARTVRQRCGERLLTGYTTWDGAYLRACLSAGAMTIKDEQETHNGRDGN